MTTKKYGALGPRIEGQQGIFLDAAGVQYMRLKRLIGGLEYIAAHPELFGGFDYKAYLVEHDQAETVSRQLAATAAACGKTASDCPQPTFVRPRELPERIVWVSIDPKTNGWTEIGRTQGNDTRVAEARGQFSFCAAVCMPQNQEWWSGTVGQFLIHNTNTGSDQIVAANKIYHMVTSTPFHIEFGIAITSTTGRYQVTRSEQHFTLPYIPFLLH